MDAAGLSAQMIERAGTAAAYYWVTGSTEASLQVLDAITASDPSRAPKGKSVPKGSSQRRTGRRTGSASRGRTAGTRTTAPHPKTSGRSLQENKSPSQTGAPAA